jgi:hypothetical protein
MNAIEINNICLNYGSVVALQDISFEVNTLEKIIADFPYKIYAVEAENNYEILKQLKEDPKVRSVFSFGDSLHVIFNEQLTMNNERFKEITPTIEDCFMGLL